MGDVRNIQGGLWKFQENFDPPFFLPDDYDQSEPLKQWNSQQPAGFQTVFQLETKKANSGISSPKVKAAVKEALMTLSSSSKIHEFNNDSNGSLFVSLVPSGTVVVTWDGYNHVDINLFTFSHDSKISKHFLIVFQLKISNLKVVLLDEQPRGYGRVVNFLDDINQRTVPRWASLDQSIHDNINI